MGIGRSKNPSKCLVVGLDNSGKSTIVNYLKPQKEKKEDVQATVGLTTEKFKYMGTNFTMFDMSGAGQYRDLWQEFFVEAEGIIFVVDSADHVRLCVAKDELEGLLTHKAIKGRGIPILLFANKSDLKKALSAQEVSKALGLNKILGHPWMISPSCAKTGEGLESGIKWISSQLAQEKKRKSNSFW